jgi:hypothetical protein
MKEQPAERPWEFKQEDRHNAIHGFSGALLVWDPCTNRDKDRPNFELICRAVNAWDDPEALRKRIEELGG